jgi:hypothetical protein
MAYAFSMRGNSYIADTLELASKIYCRVRDESGEGNSTFPKPAIRNGKSIVGVFSYNGRVWSNDGASGQVLIYDNRMEA